MWSVWVTQARKLSGPDGRCLRAREIHTILLLLHSKRPLDCNLCWWWKAALFQSISLSKRSEWTTFTPFSSTKESILAALLHLLTSRLSSYTGYELTARRFLFGGLSMKFLQRSLWFSEQFEPICLQAATYAMQVTGNFGQNEIAKAQPCSLCWSSFILINLFAASITLHVI